MIAPGLLLALAATPAPVNAVQDSRPTSRPADAVVPATVAPLPPDVAAIVDGEAIPMERYKEHLLRVHGNREIDQLIALFLLEREARELGLEVTEAEIRAGVDEYLSDMQQRLGGDPGALDSALSGQGHTRASYARVLAEGKRREILADKLCRAQREITAEVLREEFEREYGPGGVQTHVQEIWLTVLRAKLELEGRGETGAALGRENLYAVLMERGREIARRFAEGEDLEQLAREYSHDPQVQQNGGYVTGYELGRLSRELRDPVATAPLGELQGPVRTANGVFLYRVLSRTHANFEDVRADVERAARERRATWQEMRALEGRLYEGAVIQKF